MQTPYQAAIALRAAVEALGPAPDIKGEGATTYARAMVGAIRAANQSTRAARFRSLYAGQWHIFCHIGDTRINITRPTEILKAQTR